MQDHMVSVSLVFKETAKKFSMNIAKLRMLLLNLTIKSAHPYFSSLT